MHRIEKFIRIAYKYTFESNHRKFPMAAIAVKGNRVVAVGTNTDCKTHPKQQQRVDRLGICYGSQGPHAELDCLIRASHDQIKGSTVYVARRLKNLDFGLAKPCYTCLVHLRNYGVKRVHYTLTHSLLKEGQWYGSIYM